MACETITVTNTLTNDVCDGDYEKTEDILEWVNVANPTCKLVKIFDVAANSWIWAFQIHTEPGSDPPPGSSDAVVTYGPTYVKITTKTFFTESLEDGPDDCGSEEREVGESERIYVLDPGNSTRSSLNILTNTGDGSYSVDSVTHECRVTITDGGDSGWSVGRDESYVSFKHKVNQLNNWGEDPPQGNVYVNTTTGNAYGGHDTVLLSPTGTAAANKTNGSRPYWGIKHTVGGQNLNDSDRLENYGCLASMSGTYTGSLYNSDTTFRHEWQVTCANYAQQLFRYNTGHIIYQKIFSDLIDDPTGYPCWNRTWVLETDTFTNTTEDSVCPADGDWSGTGLSVTEKTTPSGGPSGGPSDIDVEIVDTGTSVPSGGPSDVEVEEEDIPCTETAIEVDGYCPLYTTENCANLNGDGSSHTHVLNGVTYYMPNGVEMFHGDCPSSTPNPPEKAPEQFTTTIVDPVSGALSFSAELISDEIFTGSTIPEKYQGYVWNQRTSSLSGPFTSKGITAVTTRDNSSEMFAVDRDQVVVKTVLTDLNDPMFEPFTDPFTRLNEPFVNERGVVVSAIGKGYLYDHKFKPSAFEEVTYGEGTVEKPLFFRDSYMSIAETNWMYFGDEHSEKQIHRVDLRFHKNSCGHLSLFVQSEDGKTKGQYKGPIKEHMKVFTNLRGRGFKICMLVATHENYPWAMREMAVGYLMGKSF